MGRRRHRTAAGLLALVVALVFVVGAAGPAGAHAALASTSPPAGARLVQAPEEVRIRFDQRVTARPGAVRVYDADGERATTSTARHSDGGRTLVLPLPSLRDGGYVTTWRAVSADGHPVGGAVTWRIGEGGGDVSQGLLQELLTSAEGDASVALAATLARGVLFAGLLVLLGGLGFVLTTPSTTTAAVSRLLWVAWAAAVVGTVAGAALEAADLAGLGLGGALRPSVVADVFDTDGGRAALARVVALVVLGAVLGKAAWQGRLVAVTTGVASVAGLLSITLAGHARTGRWVALAAPIDLVHLGAGALWLGGLAVMIAGPLRSGGSDAVAVVRRFSRAASAAVATVVVTGTVQGLRQLDGLGSLRETTYGKTLVVKIVLVAVIITVAARSGALVRAGNDAELPLLRRVVTVEAGLAIAVLAATSVLVAADPARVAEDRAFSATRVVGTTALSLVAAPARTGPVDIHLYVSDPTVGLTTAKEAAGSLSLPDRGITGLEVPFVFAGPGHFAAYDLDLPIRGTWALAVRVRIGDADERAAAFSLPIR